MHYKYICSPFISFAHLAVTYDNAIFNLVIVYFSVFNIFSKIKYRSRCLLLISLYLYCFHLFAV